MKAVIKETLHIALDGIHVRKYQEGDIVEAKSEFEKAYIQALIMNDKAEAIYDKPAKKVDTKE
jgi:hypothetical protein